MPYKDPEKRKLKHREYSRKHYEANKDKVKASTSLRKKSVRTKWMEYKQSVSCINCGFSHPAAIDFHHVNPSPDDRKIFDILRRNNFSAALEEIKNCVPLCANCHRVHHYNERAAKKCNCAKKNPAL